MQSLVINAKHRVSVKRVLFIFWLNSHVQVFPVSAWDLARRLAQYWVLFLFAVLSSCFIMRPEDRCQ